jgi:hypothetical protein
VEERCVQFATEGRGQRERRRVEIVDRDGRAREYLWMESESGSMEVWSGQVSAGRHVRQHRRAGVLNTSTHAWPDGATFALTELARLRDGKGARSSSVLDPRTGAVAPLQARADLSTPAVSLWPGTVRKTSAARVAYARAAHAGTDIVEMASEALLHPLTPRKEDRRVHHLLGGVGLTAPEAKWVESKEPREFGLLMTVENRATFARVEVYAGAVPDDGTAMGLFLRELRKSYDHVSLLGGAGKTGPNGKDGKGSSFMRIELRQGRERMQAQVRILRRAGEYVAVLGIAPVRRWSRERGVLAEILASTSIVGDG